MDNIGENIYFFLEDKHTVKNNENEIQQMMNELNEDINIEYKENNCIYENTLNYQNWMYNVDKDYYSNDDIYYNEKYTIKDLLKICKYYEIDKIIKNSKCKKQDIISTIIFFESLPENIEIVHKRRRMWSYMSELMNDVKMKNYIFWN